MGFPGWAFPGILSLERCAQPFGRPELLSSKFVVRVAIAALTALAPSACSTPAPPPNDPIAIDDQYGIPAGSVPPYLLRPDGVMTNGLLPAQPYDSGS